MFKSDTWTISGFTFFYTPHLLFWIKFQIMVLIPMDSQYWD